MIRRRAIFILTLTITVVGVTLLQATNRPDEAYVSPVIRAAIENPRGDRVHAWVIFKERTASDKSPAVGTSRALRRRALRGTRVDDKDLPVSAEALQAVREAGANVRVVSRWFNAVSIEAESRTLQEIIALPSVRAVIDLRKARRQREPFQRDASRSPKRFLDPSDPQVSYGPSFPQLDQIGVPPLHARGLTGKGVTIALLDDGFSKRHEAFQPIIRSGRLLGERDFVMGDDDVSRDPANANDYDDGHGTMTWSMIGAYVPARLIGPAYGANFLLARTEDGRTETPVEEDYWVGGLEWAEAQGADIISSSLGYLTFDDPQDNHPYTALDGQTVPTSIAANIAAEKGVLVINAMGNDGERGDRSISSPADSLGILSVGAVDSFGNLAGFSSHGPTADGRRKPEVLARGVWNYLATNEGYATYGRASGASFATPLVAATAALLLEAHPEWKPAQVIEALSRTASRADNPDDCCYGFGIINATRAVDY